MKAQAAFRLALLFFFALGLSRLLGAEGPARTPDANPEGETGALKPQVTTGGSYDAHSGNATRMVNDLHVPGALGMYGLDFTRYWNSIPSEDNFESELPVDFGDSSWTHSWRWAAVEDGEIIGDGESGPHRTWITSITITYPDGHASKFKIFRRNWGAGPHELRMGPPYLAEHGEVDWPSLGGTAHEYLAEMAYDGSQFWLRRADGGTVHFTGGPGNYQATEVFDPHGFKSDLFYDEAGYLWKVQQPGNRWLAISWGTFPGYNVPFITKVETGGDAAGQRVTYKYSRFPYPDGSLYVLAHVIYENQPAPGQTAWASYTYGNCRGDVEPCPGEYQAFPPLLKTAYDPHYAGAMTKIKYNYGGGYCPDPGAGPTPPPAYYENVFFAPQAIAAEKSAETGAVVARFESGCGGKRWDYNGFGAVRNLYFGNSAGDSQIGAPGYMLTKVTDFGLFAPSPIFRKQNGSEPNRAWDGRGIETQFAHQDGSGKPSRVENLVDGSRRIYNRIYPSAGTLPLDGCMHNPNNLWLFNMEDERHNVTTYVRDQRRRITRIEYPDTTFETYEYDNNTNSGLNQVTQHRLPSGAVVTYEYDAHHRLYKESNSVDTHPQDYTEYSYYGPNDHPEWADLVKTMTDGRARANGAPFTTRMTYNGRQQVMTVEYAPNNGVYPTVRYEYDPYANCKAITDEVNHRQEFTYDSYRRCTSLTEQIDTTGTTFRRWDWIYDRYIDGVGMLGASTHTSREWRVQVEPVFNDAGDRRLSARKFDCNNRIIEAATGLYEAADGSWHGGPDTEVHHFAYDENGQKSSYTDPLDRVTNYEYDLRNRLWRTTEHPAPNSNTTLRITDTLYDETGNKTQVTFPDLTTQRWANHDPFGQPRYFYDEYDRPTEFTYAWGPMKKLKTVTTLRTMDNNAGMETQLTEFQYDGMGRPTKTIFPAPDHSEEISTYEFGQLKTWKTRKNQLKTIVYDERGREKSNTWSLNPLPTGSPAPPLAPEIIREWDNANRLKKIRNSFAIIDYGYDTAGQLQSEGTTVTGSGVLREVSYLRYPNGEVRDTSYPDSTSVHHIYTARGQLDGVGWGVGATSYVYRPDGKVDHQTRTNGVTTSYGYNGRGMISSVRHRNDAVGADLAFREYWRDERDRITAWKRGTDHSLNGMEDGRGTRYEYDPHDGQLIRAYYRVSYPETDHPTGAVRADIFAYDELGNRKGDQNHVASRGSSMKFNRRNNGLNQYDQWETVPTTWMSRVFYDDNFFYTSEHPYPQWEAPGNGVTMADGYTTACFNALNQPIAIWSMAYAWTSNVMHFGYDPLGRCVKRWVGPSDDPNTTGATFLYYDGWNLIQEGQGGILVDRTYVHGARVDEIVASRINGTWYHHHYDAQGNCILQSNTNGAIQVQYDYDAFGYPYIYNSVGNKGLAQTRFLFTGREWLEDLRLYDYRNRMYQPELGRFLQPDPQEFRAGDYNLYRYCHNDPVNRSDPSGMTDWELKTEFSKDGKYEKVSWNATVKLPTRLGSNIPVFLHIEVTREQTNVANLTDKGGNKAAALTTAESHTSSNHVQWSILVRHNTGGYGPQWQAFSRNREPEHANRILARAQSDGAQIAFARGVLAGNLEARAQGQLDDQMKYEKWLDNQGAHTLKDANGNVVPDEK